MIIGEIRDIIRYPIKSFQGESVQHTTIESYGLYGDRSHAFLDQTRPGKFLTATQLPEMVAYRARFDGADSMERFPDVMVTAPDGAIYRWGEAALQERLEAASSRELAAIQYAPQHVPVGAIEEEHLLLTTDASLAKLAELWGNAVDYRRFRPNLCISLYDSIPFVEEAWFGRRLLIGEAEIVMKRHCERCMIITIDPDTGVCTPSLLKTIAQQRDNHFGVYASVHRTGKISTGDKIYLIEDM
ncbi:MOSC domain-containing protein [Aneurinibacillus sp. BA2021]|nr:MOSC domain-containing protein [Aneurinibacillus sp. BA2021]